MFGTERWPLISSRAFCRSAPSSGWCGALADSLVIVEAAGKVEVKGEGEGRGRGGRRGRGERTNLIHLDDVEFGAELREEGFGGAAVGAVGFGEDGFESMLVFVCLGKRARGGMD